MITKLWEYGYANKEVTQMGYGINIILDNGEEKEFKGTEPGKVRTDAMNFICQHYYETSPHNPKNQLTQ